MNSETLQPALAMKQRACCSGSEHVLPLGNVNVTFAQANHTLWLACSEQALCGCTDAVEDNLHTSLTATARIGPLQLLGQSADCTVARVAVFLHTWHTS